MTETGYLILGLISGGLLVAIALWLGRRREDGNATLLSKIELLERAQEREEKVFRDELARNREENANAGRKRRTRGLCDQIAGRRERRSSVVADRRQISDGRLSATNYGTGKRRLSANRRRDEGFGNAAQKIGERYLREIY